MTASFPDLDNFVREVPWEDIDSARVNEIPGDDDSFHEELNTRRAEIINMSAEKLLIF